MGKFDGILLCSDFDMTMGKGGIVTPENCEAIRYFQQNGGRFTIISGRNPHYLLDHQNGFQVNAPIVGFNGALILDENTREVLYTGGRQDMLAMDLAQQIWDTMPAMLYGVMHDATIAFPSMGVRREPHENCVLSFAELRAMCQLPLYNVLCCARTPQDCEQIFHRLQEIAPDCFEVARSWDKGVEIICREDCKGAASLRLKQILGSRLLITVGDYENDITMLQAADISYAVENALPHVKAAAKRQTVHYEQGAIAAIVTDLEHTLL